MTKNLPELFQRRFEIGGLPLFQHLCLFLVFKALNILHHELWGGWEGSREESGSSSVREKFKQIIPGPFVAFIFHQVKTGPCETGQPVLPVPVH